MWKGILTILISFLIPFSIVNAQSIPQLELNLQQVEVGDTFKASIKIPQGAWNETWDWSQLTAGTALDVYDVLPTDTLQIEGAPWLEMSAYLMAFDSGAYEIGPVTLNEGVVIPSNTIQVALVEVDTTKSFMDIQEAPSMPFWWGDYWIVIVVILVLAIIALVWWLLKNKKKRAEEAKVINKYNAHEWALEQLQLLQAQYAHTKPEEIKPFFEDIVHLFKKYLVYRYEWSAVEETSEEVINRLKNHEDFRRFRKEVRSLLNTSDLVKFAKASVLEEEKNKQWNFLSKMIKATQFKDIQSS